MSKLYEIESFIGDKLDTKVLTRGGTYHKVVVEDAIEGGVVEERKFFSRFAARHFAEWTAKKGSFEPRETRLKIDGHKPSFERSGSEDTYWDGSCECGWSFRGWTTRQSDVRDSHQSHLHSIINDKERP